MSPAWTWRQAALDESGARTVGFRFRLPISVGVTEFESLDLIDEVNFGSVDAFSAVPGVEVNIPLTPRWRIKPQAYLGLGLETGGGDRAKIFRFSVRSQLSYAPGKLEVQLVNGLERIGFSTHSGTSSALNMLQTGLDFSRPLPNTRIGQVPVVLSWHLAYTRYLDSLGLDLRALALRPLPIGSEWELGFAFGRQNAELSVWRLKIDRLGIAYRFESDGDFSGFGIVFRSLFDR